MLLVVLSFVLAFSLIAYGVDTLELSYGFTHLSVSGWLVICLTLLMAAEIFMIQGWYCAYLCPYGAMCAILPIEDRLTYEYRDPEHHCTECGGCVKICPIPDLDIRQGFDLRCIQCGLCEVACKKMFAKSSHPSLITLDKRPLLRASGREKILLIWAGFILFLALFGGMYLFDIERLDSCRLENKVLY